MTARKPSHLTSKDHPEPEGSGPGRDSIGTGSRRALTYRQRRLGATPNGNRALMSEAQTPEEESIETELGETPDEDVPVEDEYDGPDPEDDPKGDGSDEDQGT